MHETIIRYSISLKHRKRHDSIYIEKGRQAKLHPMSEFNKEPAAIPNVHQVPKFGTYMDLLIKFSRMSDRTSVFVVIGVIDAKELAFFAGAGDPGWVDQQFYPGKSSEVALLHGEFEKSALPIGSSFDLGIVHRVSVRQLSVEPTSENVLDDQIRKLEIEITALDVSQADHEVGPKGSCCSVQ
jgi:hypothetical protein